MSPHFPEDNRLPRPYTPFIGRVDELTEISRLLHTCRLLSLVGPGGCGKTRLALHVASTRDTAFPDGVVRLFVERAKAAGPGFSFINENASPL